MSAFVFDSNAYRTLFRGRDLPEAKRFGASLAEKQAEAGHCSFAFLFVAAELLTHLANPNDPAFDDCKKGIIGLWNHCLQDSGDKIQFLPDPELQFTKEFYGKQDDRYVTLYRNVNQLCKKVTESAVDETLNHIRPDLRRIAEAVGRSEANFVDDVLQKVVEHTNPQTSDWRIFENDKEARRELLDFLDSAESDLVISISNVLRFRIAAGVAREPKEELMAKAEHLTDNYKVPIKLYKEILKRIVQTGCDLTKKNRANWIWDMQISFFLSPNSHIGGQPIILVTDDGDIIEAASEAGASDYVERLSEYKARFAI